LSSARGRSVALVLLVSLGSVLATLAFQAVHSDRAVRLVLNRPAPSDEMHGSLSHLFEIRRDGSWRTDRYEYLWIDCQTGLLGSWHDLVHLRRHWMTLVLRLSRPTHARPEHHRSSDEIEGYLALFPGDGSGLGWRVAGGELVTDFAGDGGITLSLDLNLERSFDPSDEIASTERLEPEMVRMSKREVPLDPATPFHFFNPNNIKVARQLRYWLAEDPELVELLPARELSWALDRATDAPPQAGGTAH
jgi:hypothetical protein